MNPQLERLTNIFVVRIWHKYLLGQHPILRGEVEDLAPHERFPFWDIQELGQIVRAICSADKLHRSGTNQFWDI